MLNEVLETRFVSHLSVRQAKKHLYYKLAEMLSTTLKLYSSKRSIDM